MDSPLRELCVIYARSRNHCIGVDGGLPWSLPAEYQHFEKTVFGYPLIMGRRSYEDHDGLLANSVNIVVSTQLKLPIEPQAYLACDLTRAIEYGFERSNRVFVIGGAGLIDQACAQATTVYETIVEADISGDTFVTPFDFSNWSTESLLEHQPDANHAYGFVALKREKFPTT